MSRIPTIGMQRAYTELTTTNKNIVEFNKEHKLEFSFNPNQNTQTICYIHYGKFVAYVEIDSLLNRVTIGVTKYGFSKTDADNVNGLLKCMEINTVKCYRKDSIMYLSFMGERKGLKEVVIDSLNYNEQILLRRKRTHLF